MRRLDLRPAARADLEAIWDYTTATWSVAQARAYLEGMRATLDLLAEMPEIARERVEFRPPVRLHRYRSHMIVFVADADRIEVIRVLHGRADWASLLAD